MVIGPVVDIFAVVIFFAESTRHIDVIDVGKQISDLCRQRVGTLRRIIERGYRDIDRARRQESGKSDPLRRQLFAERFQYLARIRDNIGIVKIGFGRGIRKRMRFAVACGKKPHRKLVVFTAQNAVVLPLHERAFGNALCSDENIAERELVVHIAVYLRRKRTVEEFVGFEFGELLQITLLLRRERVGGFENEPHSERHDDQQEHKYRE